MEDIFLQVFSEIDFPFISADIDIYLTKRKRFRKSGFKSYIEIPIPNKVEINRRKDFVSALRGIIRKIDVPPPFVDVLLESDSFKYQKKKIQTEFEDNARYKGDFRVAESHNSLVWEETTIWPALYHTFLKHLLEVVNLHTELILNRKRELKNGFEERGIAFENIDTLSEYPRNLPTGIQYAFASLGAWLGGAMNFQYFGYYASIRQIHFSDLNLRYFDYIGYKTEEANLLDESGIIALPATLVYPLLKAQGDMSVFGSISIDETNVANSPSPPFFHRNDDDGNTLPGFILDKYYRAPFKARKIDSYALYGEKTIFRDHYEGFYDGLDINETLRCKHYTVPLIDVKSLEDVEDLIRRIPVRNNNGLFYRGQRKLYTIERDEKIKNMLFGSSCSVEPSLITSAARDKNYHYDGMHFALRHFIEQKIQRKKLPTLTKKWRTQSTSPICKIDMAVMALAQHYGIPSHGLDITKDLDVALWFATNVFSSGQSGSLSGYQKMQKEDWSEKKESWPVILVCQTVTHSISSSIHGCEELDDFGFKAKRPEAQHAKFFQGGHSDHQNRLAESVVCVFRLPPGDYDTKCDFESLFPSPEEDRAYKLMLEFAEHPEFGKHWGMYVNRFH